MYIFDKTDEATGIRQKARLYKNQTKQKQLIDYECVVSYYHSSDPQTAFLEIGMKGSADWLCIPDDELARAMPRTTKRAVAP